MIACWLEDGTHDACQRLLAAAGELRHAASVHVSTYCEGFSLTTPTHLQHSSSQASGGRCSQLLSAHSVLVKHWSLLQPDCGMMEATAVKVQSAGPIKSIAASPLCTSQPTSGVNTTYHIKQRVHTIRAPTWLT